jgi:DNA-binding MarR family transcriptional regulator
MKLEEEIHQKKFNSPRAKLAINIIFTHHWQMAKSQDAFKEGEITMQQFNILRILRGQFPKPCTIQLLKDRMLDKQSDVSRLVDRLVIKGWVERHICEGDRRKMDVLITQSGLKKLDEMDPNVKEMDNIFQALSNEEVDTLNHLLDKLRG